MFIKEKNNFFDTKKKDDLYFEDINSARKFFSEEIKNVEYKPKKLDFNPEEANTFEQFFKLMSFSSYLYETELMFYFHDNHIFGKVTKTFLNTMKNFIKEKRVLEVCAGRAYLARGLSDFGVDCIATDIVPLDSFAEVEILDAVEAVEKYGAEVDYIILSWSPLGSNIDNKILEAMRRCNKKYNKQLKMIVIGELGGCTNSEEFCNNAKFIDDEEFEQIKYEPIITRDRIYLVE